MKRKFSIAITDDKDLYLVRAAVQKHLEAKAQIAAIEDAAQQAMSDMMSELAVKYKAPRELNVFIDASKLDDHNVVYLQSQEALEGDNDPSQPTHTLQ
jgi:hypothetical protein